MDKISSSSEPGVWAGLWSALGHTILFFVGIACCAYATAQQLEERHSTGLDSLIFAIGLSLVSFNLVRRIIWAGLGFGIPWSVIIAAFLLYCDHTPVEINSLTVAALVLPPMACALLFAWRAGRHRRHDEPYLEITI